MEVRDHMERLQRISDLKVKPVIKDGGVLELSVKYDRHARNRFVVDCNRLMYATIVT